jgi:hypothetical protein
MLAAASVSMEQRWDGTIWCKSDVAAESHLTDESYSQSI